MSNGPNKDEVLQYINRIERLEEDGFNEYWISYTFDNDEPRNLGTVTVEI